MSVSPINVTRISHSLQTSFAQSALRSIQRDLLTTQTQIATGRNFITPSQDPVGTIRVLDLTQALERQRQFAANVQHGDNILAAADSAIGDVNTLLIEAQTLASQDVSNLTSAAERSADAELIAGLRQQLQLVGNRTFDGQYIFAGRQTTAQPFISALGGIAYVGDTGALVTRAGENMTVDISVPGNVLFSALSARIAASVDLSPALTADLRLEDIRNEAGQPIPTGRIILNEQGGAGVFTVDLTTADTLADVVDLINDGAAKAGASLTASLDQTGLTIQPAGKTVSITDAGGGAIAAGLGLLAATPTNDPIGGQPLAARLTQLTPVSALAAGNGIDLAGGLTITNGSRTTTIDLSGAETVQGIVNAINNADVFVLARINEDGTGIDVFNQVSGTSLFIGENGGTTAAELGIRTFDTDTPLKQLNAGRGVHLTEGSADLLITARDGASVEVNLDGALTVGDVINLMNQAAQDAGGGVTVSFAQVGNGIRILDTTGGTGDLAVESINLSSAAQELGIDQRIGDAGAELVGTDANPTRTAGVLTALVELEDALRRDDSQGISLAASSLDDFIRDTTRIHGVVGAESQAMRAKLVQLGDAAFATENFLSQTRDVDFSAAITQLQSAQTQLQVTLQTTAAAMNLSLLDFLR